VAKAYTIMNYLTLLPILIFCFWGTPVTLGGFLRSIALPAIGCVAMGAAIWMARPVVAGLFLWVEIACLGLAGFGAYLIAFLSLPAGRRTLMDFRGYAAGPLGAMRRIVRR